MHWLFMKPLVSLEFSKDLSLELARGFIKPNWFLSWNGSPESYFFCSLGFQHGLQFSYCIDSVASWPVVTHPKTKSYTWKNSEVKGERWKKHVMEDIFYLENWYFVFGGGVGWLGEAGRLWLAWLCVKGIPICSSPEIWFAIMHGGEKMFYLTFLNRYIWINNEYAYTICIRELSLFLHTEQGGSFLELIVDLLPFVSELWFVYRYPIAGNMSQPERDAVCGKLLAWHVVSLKCCFGRGDSCEIGNYLTNH